MQSQRGEDLGFGVFVSPAAGGEFIVTSRELALGWRAASKTLPGTAVLWRERTFEVIAKSPDGGTDRWTLLAWENPSVMRDVVPLDAESIRILAEAAAEELRARRVRRVAVWFLPFLGLLPAPLQKSWERNWGYPAERATWLSAICWMLLGAAGILQLASFAFGGEWFLPVWLRWLVVVGPLLIVEGTVRLILVAADGEPVGSALGLPLYWIGHSQPQLSPVTSPNVRLFDEEAGVLELVSPIYRADWDGEAILSYHGKSFRLDRSAQEGREWVYTFRRSTEAALPARRLRLAPAPTPVGAARSAGPEPPSLVEWTLMSAAITLAPGKDQKIWGRHLDIRPIYFTLVGAAAELIGGLINLRSGGGSSAPLLILLNFFFVTEGAVRFASAIRGRPMGSIFGWLLRPLYRGRLPD